MTGNWMKGMEQTWKMVKKITSSIYDSISAVVKWIEKLKDAREAKEKSGSGRQFGGSVGQGQATVVGEHRPEVFIPSQSGNIRQLDQSTGTGKEVNINFNNVNVRNDSDLDDIVSAVKRELSRDQELNAIGAR